MSAAAKNTGPAVRKLSENVILGVVGAYGAAFVVFGLVLDGPDAVLRGLAEIVTTRDALLTDYFGNGVGAGLVNAGLLMLVVVLIYHRVGVKITGAAVACLFLVLGLALFGKNLFNIWPIVFGVYLYARFVGEPFADHANTAFFGAALAPIFSEIVFSSTLPLVARLPLALFTSVGIGFILVPVSAQLFKTHMGFNLYNMGFTAGVIGALVVALYRSYGFVPDPVMIWTTGNNGILASFLAALWVSMIAIGFYFDRALVPQLKRIMKEPGQSPTDFLALAGFGPTLANMGLTGAIGTAYVLLIGADLNGPTIGGILTIVGFAAFGKHPRNILPIMAGVFLGSLAKLFHPTDPAVVLAALFGTTLAPIAGRFGWRWGIVAGFVHSSAALSVGAISAGLNLYNNGFAAGIVAAVLVPVIIAVRKKYGRYAPDEAVSGISSSAPED